MSNFQIIEENDPIKIDTLVTVIYGEPSMGKTSLSFTSETPILLDFDEGVHRAVNRKKTAKFKNWDGVIEFIESDFLQANAIKSLILDTGGVMLDDFIAMHAIKMSSKNGKPGGGVSLQGYGAIKEIFSSFLTVCRQKGIDLIIICHASDDKEGDTVKKRPKMTGGSYDILRQKADLLGYMETVNNVRTLEFNPTDRNVGKNSPEFKKFVLPHYTDPAWTTFLSDILKKGKEKMSEMSEAQQAAMKLLGEFSEKIISCENLQQLVTLRPELESQADVYKVQLMKLYHERYMLIWKAQMVDPAKTVEDFNELVNGSSLLEKVYQIPIKTYIVKKATEQGFAFNKELKQFEKAPTDTAEMKPEELVVKDKAAETSAADGKPAGETAPPATAETPKKGKGKAAAKAADPEEQLSIQDNG